MKKCKDKGLWGQREERGGKERKCRRCERMDGVVERVKMESGADQRKE